MRPPQVRAWCITQNAAQGREENPTQPNTSSAAGERSRTPRVLQLWGATGHLPSYRSWDSKRGRLLRATQLASLTGPFEIDGVFSLDDLGGQQREGPGCIDASLPSICGVDTKPAALMVRHQTQTDPDTHKRSGFRLLRLVWRCALGPLTDPGVASQRSQGNISPLRGAAS
jgi:hypothetical protein